MPVKVTDNIEGKPNQIKLGSASFDQSLGCIVRENSTHDLEPRVSKLLILLCSTDGVLSRESILNLLWGNSGSDEALTQAISKLRRALGDTRRPHKIIETVPKHGYRLLTTPETVNVKFNSLDKNQAQRALGRKFSEWNNIRYLYMVGLFTIPALFFAGAKHLIIQESKNIEIEYECSNDLSVQECISLVEVLGQKKE